MPGGFTDAWGLCNGAAMGALAGGGNTSQTVTAGSANVKGSWAQLIASTASDVCWVIVNIVYPAATALSIAVDIGIGSAGNEVAIINNIVASNFNVPVAENFSFPLSIPAGTRVSARCQSGTGSDACYVSVTGFDGGFTQAEGAAGVDSIGFVSASTLGTVITVSATPGVKGSYSQLTASTPRDYIGYFGSFDPQSGGSSILGHWGSNDMDISIGAGGSEVVIDPDISFGNPNGYLSIGPTCLPFRPISIPAGTRIAARAQCSDSDSASKTFGLTLYGVY